MSDTHFSQVVICGMLVPLHLVSLLKFLGVHWQLKQWLLQTAVERTVPASGGLPDTGRSDLNPDNSDSDDSVLDIVVMMRSSRQTEDKSCPRLHGF